MKKKIFLGNSTSFLNFYLFLQKQDYVINHLNFFNKKDFSNFFMFSQVNNKVFFSISLFFEDEKTCQALSRSFNVIAIYTPILNIKNYFENCERHFDENYIVKENYLNKFELLNDYFSSMIKEKYKNSLFYSNDNTEKKDKFKNFVLKDPNSVFLISSSIMKKVYLNDKKIDYLLHLYKEISNYLL